MKYLSVSRDALIHTHQNLGGSVTWLTESLTLSLAYDLVKEMDKQRTYTVFAKIKVYSFDSHSPWYRGTNEITKGLVRYL
jgi:IS30 family transposase